MKDRKLQNRISQFPCTAYLCSHHSLPFGDQGTFRTQTLSVTTFPLVTPQPRDEAMIPATGTLRSPLFSDLRSLIVFIVLRSAPTLTTEHGSVPHHKKSVNRFSFSIYSAAHIARHGFRCRIVSEKKIQQLFCLFTHASTLIVGGEFEPHVCVEILNPFEMYVYTISLGEPL